MDTLALRQAGAAIFTTVVFAAFAFWLFGVLEAVGIWRFWPWAYRAGFKVVDRKVPKPASQVRNVGSLDLPDVRAAAVSPEQILFRAPMPLFKFRINTPFPILGTAMLQLETLHIVGRIPIGPTGFLAAWLIGWTLGGVLAASASPSLGVGFVIIGWLFVGAMTGLSAVLELRRFRRAQDALVSQMAGSAA